MPYSVPFDSGAESNGQHDHKNSKSDFADNDQKREIDAKWLVTPGSDPGSRDWKDYAVCALASAAFPVGLAPRLIGATLGRDSNPDEYKGRRLPLDALHGDLAMPPAWLPNVLTEDPFWFTTADGGSNAVGLECVANRRMDGNKALSRFGSFETLHFSFASPERLMRVLSSIVGAQSLLV